MSKGKKRAQAAAAAVIASAGIMVNAAVPSEELNALPTDDAPIVLTLSVDDDGGDDLDEDEAVTDDEEKRRGISARARAWLMRLPVWKRLLLLLPLWLIGGLLIASITSPTWSWVLTAALMVLSLFAALKLAKPELPLREILSRQNLFRLFCGFLSMQVVCLMTDALISSRAVSLLTRFLCAAIAVAVVVAPIVEPGVEELLSPEEEAELHALEDELFEDEEESR